VPSFSSLFTSLTGLGFFYEKSSRHATYNFNQDGQALYRNQPRFPFEYYININLNNVGTAGQYIAEYFNNPTWAQIAPLVKTIEMPSMKIETTPLNQYNRKRLSQSKIAFEPVKVVFHDVADGKTLKFWEMYYRYYFADGSEPGMNEAKQTQQKNKTYSVESLIHNITPSLNPNIANLPASVRNLFQSNAPTTANSPTNTLGVKSAMQNIVSDTIDNHKFGFNLPIVQNIRNLIQTIDIYQVHGGRFNQVTLVNPRISAFTHDVLNYAGVDKTLELTFTFEYEYAYYTIQNMQLTNQAKNTGGETNNNSSIEPFTHGEFLELPALAFNTTLMDFVESNNPLLESDNPILQRIGKNVQTSLGGVTGSFLSDKVVRRVSASALDGLAKISPTPYNPTSAAEIITQPFKSTAKKLSAAYKDMNRIGGNPGG
jgi:hypothetical protein